MKKGGTIWFLIYALFGLYFINFAFDFITLPEFITNLDKWIIFIGGILILIRAVGFLMSPGRRGFSGGLTQ